MSLKDNLFIALALISVGFGFLLAVVRLLLASLFGSFSVLIALISFGFVLDLLARFLLFFCPIFAVIIGFIAAIFGILICGVAIFFFAEKSYLIGICVTRCS